MRKAALIAILMYSLSNSVHNSQAQQRSSNLSEHCFSITSSSRPEIAQVTTTPGEFLRNNPSSQAAINGPYVGGNSPRNYMTQGIAYLADGHQLADGDLRHVRGYFTISKDGKQIKASETLEGIGTLDEKLRNYWLVIGTHPLLVVNEYVHSQAREDRYGKRSIEPIVTRSAIGTKNGQVCFAVSDDRISTQQWAETLKQEGYESAINLGGDTYSQLAVRRGNGIEINGTAKNPARLIIFENKINSKQ